MEVTHSKAFPVSNKQTDKILLSFVGYNLGCWLTKRESYVAGNHYTWQGTHQRFWKRRGKDKHTAHMGVELVVGVDTVLGGIVVGKKNFLTNSSGIKIPTE